jgi:hypothetical protein
MAKHKDIIDPSKYKHLCGLIDSSIQAKGELTKLLREQKEFERDRIYDNISKIKPDTDQYPRSDFGRGYRSGFYSALVEIGKIFK